MGRYLDRVGKSDNPLQGLCLDGRLAPALATSKVPVATVSGGGTFDFNAPGVWGEVQDWMGETIATLGHRHASSHDTGLAQAGAVAVQATTLRRQLAPFGGESLAPPVPYPEDEGGDFPKSMAALAAMIAAGLPIRCVALNAYGGYDTHDDQPKDLEDGLKAVSETLARLST